MNAPLSRRRDPNQCRAAGVQRSRRAAELFAGLTARSARQVQGRRSSSSTTGRPTAARKSSTIWPQLIRRFACCTSPETSGTRRPCRPDWLTPWVTSCCSWTAICRTRPRAGPLSGPMASGLRRRVRDSQPATRAVVEALAVRRLSSHAGRDFANPNSGRRRQFQFDGRSRGAESSARRTRSLPARPPFLGRLSSTGSRGAPPCAAMIARPAFR